MRISKYDKTILNDPFFFGKWDGRAKKDRETKGMEEENRGLPGKDVLLLDESHFKVCPSFS